MRILSALAFVLVGACGDDGTGPGSTNLGGTWNASVSNMTSTGVSCSSTSPTQLTLTQTGATFSGSYDGGTVSCTTPGGTLSSPVGSGLVTNGQVNGNSVSFDLDGPELHHTGTVSGALMSGTAQWQVDYEGLGTITLNGNWEAARQ